MSNYVYAIRPRSLNGLATFWTFKKKTVTKKTEKSTKQNKNAIMVGTLCLVPFEWSPNGIFIRFVDLFFWFVCFPVPFYLVLIFYYTLYICHQVFTAYFIFFCLESFIVLQLNVTCVERKNQLTHFFFLFFCWGYGLSIDWCTFWLSGFGIWWPKIAAKKGKGKWWSWLWFKKLMVRKSYYSQHDVEF